MADNLPASNGENPLPTLSDWLATWLGFQLPAIPMPQTLKNLDKAVGNILLAAGENGAERINANTGRVRAKGKIAVDGLYRTDEEKRKIENKAAIVQIAVDELNDGAGSKTAEDAQAEIDDDWLNLFSRLAEDKSSDELKGLFGRILAGEIRRPGAFSLRTLQFISTLSKADAHEISQFLSYAIANSFIPLFEQEDFGPHIHMRVKMQELGLATHASMIGGLVWNVEVGSSQNFVLDGTGLGVIIANNSSRVVKLQIECQVLTVPGKELTTIANPPSTEFEYMKALSQVIFEKIRMRHADDLLSGKIDVHAGPIFLFGKDQFRFQSAYKASMPGQTSPA